MGIAESCGWGCGLAGNDVPDADAPLFPEGLDPITTPAQPLPTIEAAITIAIKHLEILFVSDLVSAIVGKVEKRVSHATTGRRARQGADS
jgi:hypothetical protein